MHEEFRELLRLDPAVLALVGANVDFYESPQGVAFPRVVLSVPSEVSGLHMNGTGPDEYRVQVDCYSTVSGLEASNIGKAVKAKLHGYRAGQFLLIVHALTQETRESGTNEAKRPYRASLDFIVTWRP